MTNFRFLKWCRDAVSRIVLPQDRITVEQELMGHLEDRYEYFREQGFTPDNAEMLTLDSMGNPLEIAPELGRIHRPFWGRTAQITRILLIAVLCLSLFFAGASLLTNFYLRPAFSSPTYESYNPYSTTEAILKVGYAYREFYSEPQSSFHSDGYTVTVSKAALWHGGKVNAAGVPEEYFPLYLQVTVTNPRIWSEEDTVSRWLWAEDDRGNRYDAPYESVPGTNSIHVRSFRTNPWTSVHELIIRDLGASDVQWVDLHYRRGNRDHIIRIDLTGGTGA